MSKRKKKKTKRKKKPYQLEQLKRRAGKSR